MTPTERRAAVLAAIQQLGPFYGFTQVDPDLVLAQAILETGHFTSNLVATQNNAFGMMQPRQRPNVSDGPGPTGFACYADLFASVQDYFLRQQYFSIPNTADPAAYVQATKASGYATDPSYTDKWLAVYRDNSGPVAPVDRDPDGGAPAVKDNSAAFGLLALLAVATIAQPGKR
jgi:hypothetical protein